MTATNAGEGLSNRDVMVWIESGDGSIARGHAESVSSSGACVRLDGAPGFESGAEVSLRLSFDRHAPSLALRARVRFVRRNEGRIECGLEWTVPARERTELEAWLSSAA
jgi:PilZ domain